MDFKKSFTLDQRLKECSRIMNKYPERIPIICERICDSKYEKLDKNKFLVQRDLTCGQFVYVIRKRLRLPPEKAIFLFSNGSIPRTSEFINNIYEQNKDKDGFLYINYSEENTFG